MLSMPTSTVAEDPRQELRVMQYLSRPGHQNVLRLLDLMHDRYRVYAVLEYCSGEADVG